MKVRFVEEAEQEFLDTLSYYEREHSGLGRQFKGELERTLRWVTAHPEVAGSGELDIDE